MAPVTRAGLVLVFAAVFAIGASWLMWASATAELEERSNALTQKISEMSREHEAAMQAASEALKARDEITAAQRERGKELEAILEGVCPFADMPLPDSLRLWYENGDDNPDAASPSSGANPDARQKSRQDSRRPGPAAAGR